MNTQIRIQAIGLPQRDLLIAMYDRFDPLGAALGLPPRAAEARHEWIVSALGQIVNVAAISRGGEVVGHCFLVGDKPSSASAGGFRAPGVSQERHRSGTFKEGAGVGMVGGAGACVGHNRFRQQSRSPAANELWVPPDAAGR